MISIRTNKFGTITRLGCKVIEIGKFVYVEKNSVWKLKIQIWIFLHLLISNVELHLCVQEKGKMTHTGTFKSYHVETLDNEYI